MAGETHTRQALEDPHRVIYPGAPLRAVAIELYFDGVLDALTQFGEFQRRHRSTFDRTLFAESKSTTFPPAILVGRRDKRGFGIGPTMMAALAFSYETGFDGFLGWAFPLLTEALELLEIRAVTRVVYSYENLIQTPSTEDIPSRLKLPFSAPRPDLELVGLGMSWRHNWPEGGAVGVDLGGGEEDQEALVLKITAEFPGPLADLPSVDRAIRLAHTMARETFDAIITDKFRAEISEERSK